MSKKLDLEKEPVNRWLAEKLDEILRNACRIADFIQTSEGQISGSSREELIEYLFPIIWGSAQLTAYAQGTELSFSRDWVILMLNEGIDRFEEYKDRVDQKIPADQPANPLPSTLQKLSDLSDEMNRFLADEKDNHTLVREKVLQLCAELKKSKMSSFKIVGDQLSELVDNQVYHNSISWENFMDQARVKNEVLKKLLNEHHQGQKALV